MTESEGQYIDTDERERAVEADDINTSEEVRGTKAMLSESWQKYKSAFQFSHRQGGEPV